MRLMPLLFLQSMLSRWEMDGTVLGYGAAITTVFTATGLFNVRPTHRATIEVYMPVVANILRE